MPELSTMFLTSIFSSSPNLFGRTAMKSWNWEVLVQRLLLTFPDQAMEADFARTRIPRVLPICQCLVCVYFMFLILYFVRDFFLLAGTEGGVFPQWMKFLYFVHLALALVTGVPLIRFKQAAMTHWTAMQFLLCMIVLCDAARHVVSQSVRLQHASDVEAWMVMTFFYTPICRAILFRGTMITNFLIMGMAIMVLPFRSFSCSAGVGSTIPLYVAELTVSLIFAWLLERMERQEYVVRMQLDEEIQVRKAAEKAAVDARDAETLFLARMSHEIRTPLNGMLGLIGLLSEMDLAEGPQDLIVRMKGAGNHLMSIVNDVLDLAKVTAGKLELKSSAMPIHEMPGICFDLFTSKLTEKHLRHHVDVAPDVPQVLYGDRTRLMQIFTNLVSNAVKFTPQGGLINMDVQLASRQPPSGQVVVAEYAPFIPENAQSDGICVVEIEGGPHPGPHTLPASIPDSKPIFDPLAHGPIPEHGPGPKSHCVAWAQPKEPQGCSPPDGSSGRSVCSIGTSVSVGANDTPTRSPSHRASSSSSQPRSEGQTVEVVLQFTIRDTGKGMTMAQQQKLFTPYYQCESGFDREQEGTGLGLSIVQRLVELMGGTLSVSSDFGKGTSLSFAIPF